MPLRFDNLETPLARLDHLLGGVTPSAPMKVVVDRWRSDAAALRFHLHPRDASKPLLLAVIGGTGTGKSTLVNRLLGVNASATSFRRTFTTGAVAVARTPADVPTGWLGVEHVEVKSDRLPARGQNGTLIIVPRAAIAPGKQGSDLLSHAVVVDTPDLDGDQPIHHAEADRAFRWAEALVFLVTPEKYQMTELLPYYRLAARYSIPSLFVMNKCEEQAVVEDYRAQLAASRFERQEAWKTNGQSNPKPQRTKAEEDLAGRSGLSPAALTLSSAPIVFTVPRDDAAYEAPHAENVAALRAAVSALSAHRSVPTVGLRNRASDLAGRFVDQILSPLREERLEADRLVTALRDMETPIPGIDVNPVTQDLERRLQQRSVLYLMGPQRVLDRVRQAPAMLVRLPRAAWDYLMRGEVTGFLASDENKFREVPDFKAMLTDHFAVLQSRIDDVLRASPIAQKWATGGSGSYAEARIAPENAGRIADEELADLRTWLEKRWNATPRDTRILQSLLKYLPGGGKMTGLAEAAPYLLTIALIAHHAVFGTDLLVLGGYTLATWLSERLSNEVAARTRATNVRIADRFTRLAHEQNQKMCAWIQHQAIASSALTQLERAAEELAETAGVGDG